MKLRPQAIFVLQMVLSYMMTGRSRMSMAMPSATSMTNSENTTRAFATLRFAGDALDPEEISRIVKEEPTRAYRKGETISAWLPKPGDHRQNRRLVSQHEAPHLKQGSHRSSGCTGEAYFSLWGQR